MDSVPLPRRLDKFVRDTTRLSLSEVRNLIHQGRIQWQRPEEGAQLTDPAALVYDDDRILYDGSRLEFSPAHHTYVLNKPKSVTTTVRDPDGKRDLTSWLPLMEKGAFPVGRLDRDTTGALLFTTDGDLSTAILKPEHKTPKLYWLWLEAEFTPGDPRLQQFESGVPILGTTARASKVEVLFGDEHSTQLLLTLREGKNRQIRRMCNALELRLLHLHRRSIGPVDVAHLPLGGLRPLQGSEVAALWNAVGGRERVRRRQREALEKMAQRQRQLGAPDVRLEAWLVRYPHP